MVTQSIVMLGTQMKMRLLGFIIKSDAQKVMAKYGFECRIHDLNYLRLDFFSSYSLNIL